MDENSLYPSNSYKSREEAAAAEQTPAKAPNAAVAKGARKVTVWHKFAQEWLPAAGSRDSIVDYLIKDIITPGLKNLLYSMVSNSLYMRLFNNTPAPLNGSKKQDTTVGRISYREYYNSTNSAGTSADSRSPISQGYLYPDTIYETRGDAQIVIETLPDILDKYNFISMADILELSGLVPNPGDFDYGWRSMDGITIERLRDGNYTIKTPKARPRK